MVNLVSPYNTKGRKIKTLKFNEKENILTQKSSLLISKFLIVVRRIQLAILLAVNLFANCQVFWAQITKQIFFKAQFSTSFFPEHIQLFPCELLTKQKQYVTSGNLTFSEKKKKYSVKHKCSVYLLVKHVTKMSVNIDF